MKSLLETAADILGQRDHHSELTIQYVTAVLQALDEIEAATVSRFPERAEDWPRLALAG